MARDTIESRIAGLSSDGPETDQVISGVAIGVGDITRGLSGDRKVWEADELEAAAESLVGGDVKALHSEAVVGEVVDAGFAADKGVVYEARIDDPELAEGVDNGRLTVSVEASHEDGGTVETDQGEAMRAADIEFSDIAIVQRGASPSASADTGEAEALSPAQIHAALEEDDEDPASEEGDPEDIEISDSVEEGLQNKVDEHNEEVDDGKTVTLGQLKKVFRRGAGAWFSSNKGATQQQWAYARVNEALKDIRNEKAINHGNDNDIFEDSIDYSPPSEEQSAALVDVNGETIDLEAPSRIKNAAEAALDAKSEYAEEIGDCGTGVGEDMAQAIVDDDLTPDVIATGGDIASNSPATYLDGHGDEGPSTDDPPTDWSREEWLGMSDGGSPRCGPVQLALWGFYPDWFEARKSDVEAARESESNASDDVEIPDEFVFGNPGEAVSAASDMGFGDGDLAGDELIHTRGDGEDTEFFPGPTRSDLVDELRDRGELPDDAATAPADIRLPFPSENVQLLYPSESVAADAADAMGLDGVHTHEFGGEGETWYMPGESHEAFVDAVGGLDAGLAGLAPVAALAEKKNIGPIGFEGTREGELDESEIPNEGYEEHYLNAGDTKSESSFPLVDGDGMLRRGNLDAAWNLRGQGDLGLPRDSAERLMLNMGLVFGPPDSEANPLPEEAYDGRETGTPYAAEEAAESADVDAVPSSGGSTFAESTAAAALAEVSAGLAPNDLGNSGEGTADARLSDTTMTQTHDARLGSHLADEMANLMEDSDMERAEMMEEMAQDAGMSMSGMRSIARGDTMCPGVDAMEAMSEVLDADMGMLVAAAEDDGCEYASLPYHSDDDKEDESMSEHVTELKARLTEKEQRIEELEAEVDSLRGERDQVATEYAEALAAEDSVLDADDYVEKFEVEELAEKYEALDDTTVADADQEPAVRSGSAGSVESESLSAADRDRADEIESRLSDLEDKDHALARNERERLESELAELTED